MLYEVVTGFPIFRKHCDMTFVPSAQTNQREFPFLTSTVAPVKFQSVRARPCGLERYPQRELPDARSRPAKAAGCGDLAESGG